MEKSQAIFLFIGALCLLSLSDVAYAKGKGGKGGNNLYHVKGMVYCDTCRIQFITRVSTMMEGATVSLQCRNLTAGTETFKSEAVTDKLGMYTIKVDGDHEDDICQIVLVKSPDQECSEIPNDVYANQAAKVTLTSNNGEASDVRNANALGFMRKQPLPECPEVLKELDMYDVPGTVTQN